MEDTLTGVNTPMEAGQIDPLMVIHELRKEIDANIFAAEQLLMNPTGHYKPAGREIALVRTKLQEAKMWAGKILEVMGAPFPAELADNHPDRQL